MDDLSPEVLTCFARINQSPQDPAAWSDLLYALAVGPSPLDVWATLPLLAQNQQNRTGHLMVLCRRLANERRIDSLMALLVDTIVDNDLLVIPRFYVARYYYLIDFNLNYARNLYEEIFSTFPFSRNFTNFLPEERRDLLDILQRTLFSLLGVRLFEGMDAVLPEEQIVWPELGFCSKIAFAACDEKYLHIYGEPFAKTVCDHLPNAVSLIHVINPTAEGEALRDRLQQDYPSCHFSFEQGPANIPYYAARRFMLAGALHRHFGRDLFILDIDAVLTDRFAQDVNSSNPAELALWWKPSFEGADNGIYEGLVIARGDSSVAADFFAAAGRWYHTVWNQNSAFWHWDGFGLHYGLAELGKNRSQVTNLVDRWPDFVQRDQALPHRGHGEAGVVRSPEQFALLQRTLELYVNPARYPQAFEWLLS